MPFLANHAILLAMALTGAAPPPGTPIAFLACPVAQDKGPETDLCFFAENRGHRYSLTGPFDFSAPQLHHKVLVEGTVTDKPAPCGGLSFEGRFSVMPEIDPSCDTIMPPTPGAAYGDDEGADNETPAGQAMMRRIETNPALSIRPVYKDAAPTAPPKPPFKPRSLTIWYPYDSDRGSSGDMIALMDLVRYAQATHARVTIRAARGQTRLDDGTLLTEESGIAARRSDKLTQIVIGLGIPPSQVSTDFEDAPSSTSGWRSRVATLQVDPAH